MIARWLEWAGGGGGSARARGRRSSWSLGAHNFNGVKGSSEATTAGGHGKVLSKLRSGRSVWADIAKVLCVGSAESL